MATLQELEQALFNADRAGDTDAARKLAAVVTRARMSGGAPSSTTAKTPTQATQSDFGGVGRQLGLTARYGIEGATAGAGTFTDPIINAIGGAVRAVTGSDYDPATLASIGQHVANALGLPEPATQTERIIGAATKGLAGGAGAAGLASQAAKMTTGGTQAIAQQLAAQPAMQAAAGGAAGTAGQTVAESGGGSLAQLGASLAAGIATPAAAAGARRVAALPTTRISPEQQAILDAGKAAEVPLMTSDVLPPGTFLGKQAQAVGERIPLIGTGAVRQAQQGTRQEAVSALAEKYGTPSYEAIVSSLKGKIGNIKRAAGNVIDKTGQQLDAVGNVTPTKSIQAIDNAISKLSQPNVFNPGNESHIQSLTDLKGVLSGGEQTFTTLRQSRTAVRDLLDSTDAAGRSQLPSYPKKLITQVYGAMKNDMSDFASANLTPAQAAKLDRANNVYGNEANLLQRSRLKNVLDKGDITPENVRTLIYSNKPSENQILYNSLGTLGRQNVKSALINDAAEKATSGEVINPNRFGVELAKHNKKLDIFFKGDERKAINGLHRVLQITRRAQDAAAAPTTTGATAVPYTLGGAAIANLPATIVAAVSGGALARAYESAPVRDLLLKLSNTRPNTRAESAYVQSLISALREELQRQPNTKQQD